MSQVLDNQTASFYGQFVQAAYAMFKNPQSADPLRPEPSGIPPTYELGAWILMSDFLLGAQVPAFYGIVVHGVNDLNSRIIAIRGTEGAVEWLDDAAAIPVPFRQVPSAGRVAQGFDKIYDTLGGKASSAKRHRPGSGRRAGNIQRLFRGATRTIGDQPRSRARFSAAFR